MRELILDTCNMQDEVLAHLLSGAVRQGKDKMLDSYGTKKVLNQHLMSFTYANNSIGEKSVEQLRLLLP